MDFEYAIKKDVRNNPIVREVDEARQRELWRSDVVGGLLVGVVLFSLWQRFSVMRIGYPDRAPCSAQRSEEEEVKRQLRLEVETLSAPRRIERLATGALHLVHARSGHVIERVTSPLRRGRSSPRAACRSGADGAERRGRSTATRRRAAARRARHPVNDWRATLRRAADRAAPSLFVALGRRRSRRGWSTCRSSSTAS